LPQSRETNGQFVRLLRGPREREANTPSWDIFFFFRLCVLSGTQKRRRPEEGEEKIRNRGQARALVFTAYYNMMETSHLPFGAFDSCYMSPGQNFITHKILFLTPEVRYKYFLCYHIPPRNGAAIRADEALETRKEKMRNIPFGFISCNFD
jgi:hypothetical protein